MSEFEFDLIRRHFVSSVDGNSFPFVTNKFNSSIRVFLCCITLQSSHLAKENETIEEPTADSWDPTTSTAENKSHVSMGNKEKECKENSLEESTKRVCSAQDSHFIDITAFCKEDNDQKIDDQKILHVSGGQSKQAAMEAEEKISTFGLAVK